MITYRAVGPNPAKTGKWLFIEESKIPQLRKSGEINMDWYFFVSKGTEFETWIDTFFVLEKKAKPAWVAGSF